MTRVWAVVPAAGTGSRFGGDVPKQYVEIAGRPLIAHTLDALLAHPRVDGAMVALGPDDARWPGWTGLRGKRVLTCVGGADRAASVLAALDALALIAGDDTLVLVHDAARPNLQFADLDRLVAVACDESDGALLASPVRDTLKRVDASGHSEGTVPREQLWRALTPQAARLNVLRDALRSARDAGVAVTDEAMALERAGLRPRLVEGREDNIKLTAPGDRALVEFLLQHGHQGSP
ncbi:2-C-methyl-D-erythritol 4-phosphate cytidylyltransferase [Lysobacter sp. TY2-98]|uniref:2-C-methyl-D-erythritol 4-phosphate cytidylyltransferase n=1 Tax=Lysobacter sp. TY2-98 TaxID=2290922 RepID=UPI000E200A1C|nr:2-C-methyl-D-erythritol 4-phosphate cytidylyltransferase [Lysobacter sp. TY2-98]AXK72424.1 2-C-methyl-D-erythritol 4-phosphate cytidylyltransferase [Lysobacter sp. TY2-98]